MHSANCVLFFKSNVHRSLAVNKDTDGFVRQALYSAAQYNVSVCEYLANSSRDQKVLLDILQLQACISMPWLLSLP